MINPVGAVRDLLVASPRITTLIVAIMLFALGNQAINAIGVIYTAQRYHWTPSDRGLPPGVLRMMPVIPWRGAGPVVTSATSLMCA